MIICNINYKQINRTQGNVLFFWISAEMLEHKVMFLYFQDISREDLSNLYIILRYYRRGRHLLYFYYCISLITI